ncbi:methylcrotonoyl-CoA carboxylase [Zavarzinia compransoris]|uniref:Methylcrotonoyl-CoA carboxylase n=2 Tax=Zavarzinia compransoris TaxID=1264899 RepID=A0A317E5U1_9PROT|nr:biotin carboxylase N-terminal domain-containing protein [Zavarzinia compransoris]PWR22399.1 methylcrotonoyl-CoA carboxylase [Zavarzinia compransoris]
MIESLLIANRGEIACRIIRTARRLGIRTIAVYSAADAGAPHVLDADEAVAIGPAPAAQSYLQADRILAAAREVGAAAIHPGYGFLSENAGFAEAVAAAGLVWVGPPAAAIRAMGLKGAAKSAMQAAGVPVTPGYHGDDQDENRLAAAAAAIGYPVLIKAVAGGGGKGMRKVLDPAGFAEALASCRREAAASFGDDRVLIEKFVASPRHIEVQVFADRHGNTVHLFERDCSLQRRHQKVIEEAPAPGMTDEARAAICDAAVRAARAVGYEGAGTVEFIADASAGLRPDRIWFMEMNTRLQVEHPVTELVTGLDLVEWQLRVASGEPLPRRQDDIVLTGHAMEARLYAEDPRTGFLPSTGPLDRFRLPAGLRVDTGVVEGGQVTAFYDPMVAKLIVGAATRPAAARALAAACRAVEVWPVKTNAAFLARLLDQADFVAGAVDTGFIEARLDHVVPPGPPPPAALQAAARFLVDEGRAAGGRAGDPWRALTGFRLGGTAPVVVPLHCRDELHRVELQGAAPAARAVRIGEDIVVFHDGEAFGFRPARIAGEIDGGAGGGSILSPMPGRVVEVAVAVGERVTKGQSVATVEAMKMELVLKAAFDGKVAEVPARPGDQVVEGQLLVRLEKEG